MGVSTDSLATQKKFAESLKLPFPLLADEGGKVAAKWGVKGAFGFASRVTFVVEPGGKVGKVIEGKDALDPSPSLKACPARPGSIG